MSKTAQLILILFLLLALLAAGLLSGLIDSNRWRIQKLEVEAPFKRVSAEQIRRALAATPERSFFRLNAHELRKRLQELDWVDRVSVVKKWPDTLQIRLFEHEPVAIWNDDRLLNRSGQVFAVADVEALSNLPRLHGRDVTAGALWDEYQRFNNLLQATGTDIQSVTVSNRGAWELTLRNGMKVYAGSRQLDARLGRLADSWDALMQLGRGVPEYVDLRYPNGYASKWAAVQPANRQQNEAGNHSDAKKQMNG